MDVAATIMRRPEQLKMESTTTLGITAIEIPFRIGSHLHCSYEFNVRPICGVITYFPFHRLKTTSTMDSSH